MLFRVHHSMLFRSMQELEKDVRKSLEELNQQMRELMLAEAKLQRALVRINVKQ